MSHNMCLSLRLKTPWFLLTLWSLSKLFHKLTALYWKDRWPVAVLFNESHSLSQFLLILVFLVTWKLFDFNPLDIFSVWLLSRLGCCLTWSPHQSISSIVSSWTARQISVTRLPCWKRWSNDSILGTYARKWYCYYQIMLEVDRYWWLVWVVSWRLWQRFWRLTSPWSSFHRIASAETEREGQLNSVRNWGQVSVTI